MSTEKRTFLQLIGMAFLFGFIVMSIVTLYVVKSGKIAVEYVQESKAARHYQNRFEDASVALTAVHDSLASNRVQRGITVSKLDSTIKIISRKDFQIQALLNEKQDLLDSISHIRNRNIRISDLEPVKN